MGKKKPFINKKTARKYALVYRSQKDPLINDEDAPDHVLRPVDMPNQRRRDDSEEDDGYLYGTGEFDDAAEGKKPAPNYEEYAHMGLPDDGYDYSQHLREMGRPGGVFIGPDGKVLDSEAELVDPFLFGTKEKEEEKIPFGLRMSMPDPTFVDLPEDIAAALDGDVEEFDELEDDFFDVAGGKADQGEGYDWRKEEMDKKMESFGFGIFKRRDGNDEEEDAGSSNDGCGGSDVGEGDRHYGGMSMASTVSKYRKGLHAVDDDKLELMMDAQYNDFEIGELDEEIAEGYQDVEHFDGIFDEFLATQAARQHADNLHEMNEMPDDERLGGRTKEQLVAQFEDADEPDLEEEGNPNLEDAKKEREVVDIGYGLKVVMTKGSAVVDVPEKEEQWDCESILSTYTNVDNHPGIIRTPIKLDKRGIPQGVLPPRKRQQQEEESSSDDGSESPVNLGVKRNKCETKAEKKARKKQIKEERRLARLRKKEMKGAFKDEQMRQMQHPEAGKTKNSVIRY